MADDRFDLIFRGDIVLGQPLSDVKQRLQRLFKADEARIEGLFTGRPVALKRQLDAATAQKYQKVLQQAGALVEVVRSRASVERPAGKHGFSLAPLGGLLLKPGERLQPVPPPVLAGAFTLRPAEGLLLDREEVSRAVPEPVIVPELDLAAVGEYLLSEEARGDLPLATVEPGDWGLAEVGSDLLTREERRSEVPAVTAPTLEVAPVGSDLGELKQHRAPVAPDISGLRLEGD